ncbi:class I adenylate-forming enzyme family protein [Pseudoduganella chitinolytica]|uniref:Class I adenylate-forming enzyme family protein n=1 Tax=Pseudoduganella chitinolytica TaxID=34070 RepID=A0ABY8BHY1_9BURK|nr:class I adenylate-forming enzyme family protein [Pseudoduganella chitinolytica]WEF33964.1 class I adenylate-forming enzyme family protein [Pseudoduganella chitinolytica]
MADPLDIPALLAALPSRLAGIVQAHAAATPGAPALRDPHAGSVDYASLWQAVQDCAAQLRALGVRPGDRVMVVGENCANLVALLFAAGLADAWIVNVNARLSGPEVDALRSHSGARIVLYTANVSPQAQAHGERHGAPAMAGPFGPWLAGALNDDCVPEPVHADGAAQPAALVYTTGTTGQPKGVMLSHRGLLYVAAVSSRLRGLVPHDRAYGALPTSHVYGLASVMLGTLYAGACLVLAPRFTAEGLLQALREERLTILQGVPAMFARLLELAGDAPSLPNDLRFAYAGGSPLTPSLKAAAERLLGVALHNGYGMTESGPTISQTDLAAPRADTSVGYPIPGVALRIVDGAGTDVAPGQPGVLWVRSPGLMLGYYRDPAQTAAALRPGGWLDTGDMGRQDADGALFIVGRTKELIIRSGFNVYPLEVETVLNAHPAVAQSAVVGRACADGNEEVIAYVEPDARAARAGLAALLAAHAAAALAPYKRPGRIVVLEALPAAATGKILKGRLQEMAARLGPVPAGD